MRRAEARVNLAAVERNCARLREIADAELCAVVKADAYGHGAAPVARAALAGGAHWLAVAAAEEAVELRANRIEARILVMGAVSDEELPLVLEAGADVVAWREDFVERLADAGLPARVHVKLDTGMGRLGTRDMGEARRVADLVESAPTLELIGAMTHFATADELGDEFFGEQLERFMPFADDLRSRGALAHAANSAGTLRSQDARLDLVRCGIAVYGMDPFHDDPRPHGLEPVLELWSYVAEIKPVAAGESAGYGRRFVAELPTELATVPIGYGDGVRRALTNNADVLIGGRRHPVVGTVSMDNITVDIGSGPGPEVGDRVVLIGADGDEQILAEEWARRLDTINYEVTCGLTPRVPRVYHRDGVEAAP